MIKYFQKLLETGYRPLLIALAVNFLLHLPFINRPPESAHVWRQCNTLAMARNFYEEGMNILEPKVDNRLDQPGITGSNFPAYEWGLAALYKITGEQFWVHRLYTTLIFFAGIVGCFVLLLYLFKHYFIANAGAIALLFFPDLFYFQLNALPDILAFTTMIWGFYYFVYWFDTYKTDERKSSLKHFLFCILLLALSGLVKLYFLLIGFAIVGILLQNYKLLLSVRIYIYLLTLAIISVGIPLAWYAYAIELIKQSGLADFGLEVRSEKDPAVMVKILSQNILSDLPELILNFANTVFVLAACYYFFKKKTFRKNYFLPALCLFAGIIFYHIVELRQMKHHSYYMMPYYPFLAFIVAYGAYQLWTKNLKTVVVLLLLLNPVFASIRILPARWMSKGKLVPQELYEASTRTQLIQAVPNHELCIVGEDQSNCIYYYYLHKKGFGFSDWKELVKKEADGTTVLENYTRRGARYLYIRSEEIQEAEKMLLPYLANPVITVGEFHVYKLK